MHESRLFRIVYYLIEKGKATATELSEKFEVSVRTIYRDIDVISSAGIPIYATQGKGGGISILDDFVLDKSLFSETEREQILMGLQGVIATEGNVDNELLTKLSALFQIKATSWIEVDFSDWIQNKSTQDIFNAIKTAILNKNMIVFRYFNSNGNKTMRHVKPFKLIFKSKNWYLYGFCLLKQDYRFFKLTRIKDLEVTLDTFYDEFVSPTIAKRIQNEKTINVKLKFDPYVAFRIYDEFSDKVMEDEQGYLYVNTDLPDNETLYSYLLSYADYVEIIGPQEIRDKMKKKVETIYKKYRT